MRSFSAATSIGVGARLDRRAGPPGDVRGGDVVGERLPLEVVPAPRRRRPASAATSASWTASMTSSRRDGSAVLTAPTSRRRRRRRRRGRSARPRPAATTDARRSPHRRRCRRRAPLTRGRTATTSAATNSAISVGRPRRRLDDDDRDRAAGRAEGLDAVGHQLQRRERPAGDDEDVVGGLGERQRRRAGREAAGVDDPDRPVGSPAITAASAPAACTSAE